VAAYGVAAEGLARQRASIDLARADAETLLPAAVLLVAAASALPLSAIRSGPLQGEIAHALVAGPAETPRGLAVCLAAARAALSSDDPELRRAVLRFLTTRRRERFFSPRSSPSSDRG
jgi:hypothetical protein